MREIKFRAWDKASRKILEVIEIDLTSMEILVLDHDEMEAREAVYGHYELMQYTGLKDVNCTEIYEGDILKHTDTTINSVTTGPVYWKKGSLLFEVWVAEFAYEVPVHTIHMKDDRGYKDTLEVIGNIYEDPHLLKKEDE